MKHDDFNRWMREIANAAVRHCHDGMYVGEDGAKRFAREVGVALPDFSKDDKDLRYMMPSTYSGICVIAYDLRPPIDSKVWFTEMRKGIKAALEVVPVPMPEDYKPAPLRLDSSPDSYKAMWAGDAREGEHADNRG